VAVKINAKFIKHMLVTLEMNQKDLASKSAISEQTLTRIMKGKVFSSDTLGKLADALKCNPIDLIDGSEFSDPHVGAPTFAIQGTKQKIPYGNVIGA